MHEVRIVGLVTIKQGRKVVVRNVRNHFVDAGLKGILSTMIFKEVYAPSYYDRYHWYLWANSWKIDLGSDTSTPTTPTMSNLVSPLGVAPSSKTISTKDGSGDGIWEATYIATWDAGTVSGTVGELGLFMRAPDKTTFQWRVEGGDYTPPVVMVSRLSSADGDFTEFTIDETKPLTVDWKVRFSFV